MNFAGGPSRCLCVERVAIGSGQRAGRDPVVAVSVRLFGYEDVETAVIQGWEDTGQGDRWAARVYL